MAKRAIGALLLGWAFLSPFTGWTATKANDSAAVGPIQAEFLAYLNVSHLAGGSTLFARTTAEWTGLDCTLPLGAILEAKVENVSPRGKGTGESTLALSFTRAQCNGNDMKPFSLVLAAVAAPPTSYTNTTTGVFLPIRSFSNPNGNGMQPGFGSSGIGDMTTTHLEFSGIQHHFPFRPELQSGDVIDIKGLKLEVGTGPNQSSILTAKNRDVSLQKYTQILLVPAVLAFRPSDTPPVALHPRELSEPAQPSQPAASPAPFVDTLETCAPPGCAVDLPVSADEFSGHAAASIPVRALGYTPRTNKVTDAFDDDDALAWLGPRELLLTINPHTLIRRDSGSGRNAPVRVIRAIVLDASSHSVLRAVDWELADYGRYLWQLDGDRVLVHVGNELRVYGSGLNVESRIPLNGPLAFVRIAPNGQLMAVATLKERHSAELHARLREESGLEPEEDVDVAILDKDYRTIGQASTSSGLLPPTLLNEGQVKLLAQPRNRYRLAMTGWDNKSATLARFESLCTPDLSSIAPDLLFLMTCSMADGAAEYRVLRSDGKSLLHGKSGPKEIGHDASGNARTQTFAVKVVRANRQLSPGAQFRGSELESEEVRVYRASDGKRLLAVRVDDPGTSHAGYALSPDGSQLAVLAGSEIRLFPVPAQ